MASDRDKILQLITELGHTVPSSALSTICDRLEQPGTPDLSPIKDSAARKKLGELIVPMPEDDRRSIAWALRASSHADDWNRERESLDLVWTGPQGGQSTLRRTEQALTEVIRAAQSDLWLVSYAGYKLDAVTTALIRAAEREVRVRFVFEDPEVSRGKVVFSALEGLGESLRDHATVYVWPLDKRLKNDKGKHGSLHVKCTLADDSVLFVTSANLTDYAMQLNMELGVLIRGGDEPRKMSKHLDWLVRSGYLIEAPD